MIIYLHSISKGKLKCQEIEVEEKPKTYKTKDRYARLIKKSDMEKLFGWQQSEMYTLSDDSKPFIMASHESKKSNVAYAEIKLNRAQKEAEESKQKLENFENEFSEYLKE